MRNVKYQVTEGSNLRKIWFKRKFRISNGKSEVICDFTQGN